MKRKILLLLYSAFIAVCGYTQSISSEGLNAYSQAGQKKAEARINGIDHDGGKVFGGSVYATEGSKLRKVFNINITDGGSYYFSAHAMGIHAVPVNAHAEGESGKLYPLQPVAVYLDGQYLGNLTLGSTQWHSTSIKGAEMVKLTAGKHTLAFEGDAPAYPEVDAIRITRNAEKAAFDMTRYNNYIASLKANGEKNKNNTVKLEPVPPKMKSELVPPAPTGAGGDDVVVGPNSASNNSYSWEVTPYALSNPLGNYRHMMTVPVVYTYYRKFTFSAGQNITFHTVPIIPQSYTAVDPVMYVYCETNNTGWSNDDYTGLHPRVQFTAPVTGSYYLVLRAYSSYYASTPTGSQGLVHVYQNGSLLQSDVPVSGYMASMGSANSGIINFFTGYSTGTPRLWLTTAGAISPIKFHGAPYWYISPMDYNWFDDARFRISKSGSGNVDYYMLVSAEGGWWVYWGNCDLYGAVKSVSSNVLSSFPNLKNNDAMQTAPSTNTYNCASWAGGITSGWFWGCLYPSQSGGSCNPGTFYGSEFSWSTWDNYFGNNPARYAGARTYTRDLANSANAEVALWSTNGSLSGITHLSNRREANNHPHGYDWESKPGGLERIFHPMNALSGASYGNIFGYYRDANRDPYAPWGRMAATGGKKQELSMDESVRLGLTVIPRVELVPEEKSKLAELNNKHRAVASRIETLYNDWFRACSAEELISNSNPLRFIELSECQKLVSYSEQNPEAVMAFLMDKIVNGDEAGFETQMSSMLFTGLTHSKYGKLMVEVKDEWSRNNYTKDGAYIAPLPLANTKNYIKKILNVQSSAKQAVVADSDEQFRVYPNPATDRSQVIVQVKETSVVTIGLYNFKGILVSTLAEGKRLEAGTYQYPLNASRLEPGIYYCKINVNGQLFTRKLMVQ